MSSELTWAVRRVGGTVQVEIARASRISASDTDAIAAATEDLLTSDGVSVLQLEAPALWRNRAPERLERIVWMLELLAERHGKSLVVAPI